MIKHKISTELIATSEGKVRDKYRSVLDKAMAVQTIFSDLDAMEINSYLAALEVYFHIIVALELNFSVQSIKERERNKLKDMAEKCLRFCQIQPVTSQHSHLYTRLFNLIAANSLRVGEAWESIGQVMIGEYLGRDSKETVQTDAYVRGMQAWQLGHLRIAKIAFHTLEAQPAIPDHIRQELSRLMIRIYRLSSESEQALSRIAIYRLDYPSANSAQSEAELEELLCSLQKGADPKALYDFLHKRRHELGPFESCLGQLWLCASRYRDIWVSFSGIKEGKGKKGEPQSLNDALAASYVSTLENLYNQDKPLQQRLELLGKKLMEIRQAPDPELALLFLAGAIRWLNRSKQLAFAAILIEEYKALSLRYSEGRTVDSLGMIKEVIEQLPVVVDKDSAKHQGQLYTGAATRFLKVAQLVSKALFSVAVLRMKNISIEEKNQRRLALHGEVFAELEQLVGELKGPMMKAAQLMAAQYYSDGSNLNVLQGIYDNAPPLPFEVMREQIEKEMGGSIDTIFKEFTPKAIAVTSMSEVFRARLHDDTEVAVKVMYPRIEEVMEADLRLIKLLTPIMRRIKSQEQIDIILQQFVKRFVSECDYGKEAATHQHMFESFKGDRDVLIPKVFTDISTRRVLVTEYVEGIRLDHFMREATQDERNYVGAKLLRFGMLSTIKHGVMHIDPHMANFIVVGDQVLAFDFGAVSFLGPKLLEDYRKVMMEKYLGRPERIYEVLVSMGYVNPKNMSQAEFVAGPGPHFVNPYNDDRVRPFYESGDSSAIRYFIRTGTFGLINPNPEDFFPNMASSISEELLARLGSQVNWHRLLGEMLIDAGLLSEQDTKQGAS